MLIPLYGVCVYLLAQMCIVYRSVCAFVYIHAHMEVFVSVCVRVYVWLTVSSQVLNAQ